MAYVPPDAFPEPGKYLRYWDRNSKRTQYLELVDLRAPLTYVRRLGSVASGGTSSPIQLPDLSPSRRLSHRYKVFFGFRPGGLYRLSLPAETEQLNFDTKPKDITFDLTRAMKYAESPYDAPTFSAWVEPDSIPSIEAMNVMERTSVLEVYLVIGKYRVKEEEPDEKTNKLDPAVLKRLLEGTLPSIPVFFGGDM